MLGNRYNPAYAYESTPAGEMGPRGCEPLVRPRVARINAGTALFDSPRTAKFSLGASPVQIAKVNPNRAILTLTMHIIGGAGAVSHAWLAPMVDLLAGTPPKGTLGAVSGPAPNESILAQNLLWPINGAMVTSGWYGVADGPGMSVATVTEWEYWG